MQTNSSKKRTAVVATAVAAALMLTGTFAWTLATDDTVLNEFEKTAEGTWNAEIEEDFDPADPWADKNVRVVNTADNPIIVRVRFEEFFDLTYRNGTNYSDTANGESIFQVPSTSTLTGLDADSSTDLDNAVTLTFADGVVTMADYTGMDEAAKADVKWVIDTDGWCYYTTAISADEKSTDLLDLVTFNKDVFDTMYDAPYDLNYYINVRLQAMSSDLSSFGSTTDVNQWTNEGSSNDGRVIQKGESLKEILTDTTITPEAKALVMSIPNPAASQGKYAANTTDLNEMLADTSVEKVTLSKDYTLASGEQFVIPEGATKTIDLGGATLNADKTILSINDNANVTLENGTINLASGKKLSNVYEGATLTLDNVDVTASLSGSALYAYPGAELILDGSTIENTDAKGKGIALASTASVKITNGSVVDAGFYGVYVSSSTITGDSNVVIEDSTVSGGDSAVLLTKKMHLVANNTVFNGGTFGIDTVNTEASSGLTLTDCTVNSSKIGIFKADSSPMSLTNCTVNVTGTEAGGDGICVREGDVTLNNVIVNVGGTATTVHDTAALDEYYQAQSGYDEYGYNALAVILNGYGNINLTITGGSYTTAVDGAQSVYVCNDGMNCATTPATFSHSITVSGNPTFSPAFTFGTYDNTTVTVK